MHDVRVRDPRSHSRSARHGGAGAREHDVRARDPRSHSRSARHGGEGARVHDVHVYDPHNHSRSAHHGDGAHDRDVLHAHHGCDAHARDRSRRNLRTPWNLSLICLPYELSLLIRLFFYMNI